MQLLNSSKQNMANRNNALVFGVFQNFSIRSVKQVVFRDNTMWHIEGSMRANLYFNVLILFTFCNSSAWSVEETSTCKSPDWSFFNVLIHPRKLSNVSDNRNGDTLLKEEAVSCKGVDLYNYFTMKKRKVVYFSTCCSSKEREELEENWKVILDGNKEFWPWPHHAPFTTKPNK